MVECSSYTGQRVYLDRTDLQLLCVRCESEIFCCENGADRIRNDYGLLLCSRCRMQTEKLPSVNISEIDKRLQEISETFLSLNEEILELEKERKRQWQRLQNIESAS
jgi:hypothetical protein